MNALEPFYNYTRSVSNNTPALGEAIGITWGLNDLFSDIEIKEGTFTSSGPEVRAAFAKGVEKLKAYQELVKGNDLYYVAQICDLCLKAKAIE
jgi:hypothetical protein